MTPAPIRATEGLGEVTSMLAEQIRAARCALVVLVVSCGGNSAANGATCGPGTALDSQGQCVPVGAGGAGNAGAAGSAGAAGAQADASAGSSAGGAGGVADTGAPDTDTGADAPPAPKCPEGLPGPKLVAVPSPGGVWYCIDSTEVTGGSYWDFVVAKRLGSSGKYDMTGQPAGCEGNDTYVHWKAGTSCEGAAPKEPANCVNWCDAYMYCKWAGKHLCGKIGGGTLPASAATDASQAEWYNACSAGGKVKFPYGDTFDPNACNTPDLQGNPGHVMPAGAMQNCRGPFAPFDAVFDLSGNVWEWIDSCEGGGCVDVGGGYGYMASPDDVSCLSRFPHPRLLAGPAGGLRCCADVTK
jgi:hypothetical protein